MGWIEKRILAEHKKHSHLLPNDWAKLAESKIIGQLKEDGVVAHR